MSERLRFGGEIAGVGSASGIRVVVGHWTTSPYGSFTDVMLQQPDGWRLLLAPSDRIAAFVSSTYVFDETVVGPVDWSRRGVDVVVSAQDLELRIEVGARTRLGRLLRLVPPRVATAPAWSRMIAPVSGVLVPGVRTYGSAGSGRWEAYGATDLHGLTAISGRWRGQALGELAPVDPPVSVGFASTPRRPGLTTLVTTVGR